MSREERSEVYLFIAVGGPRRGGPPTSQREGCTVPFPLPLASVAENLRSVGLDKTSDRIFIICNLHGAIRLVKPLSRDTLERVANFTRVRAHRCETHVQFSLGGPNESLESRRAAISLSKTKWELRNRLLLREIYFLHNFIIISSILST